MNGTRTRIAIVATCIIALAAPSSALAGKKKTKRAKKAAPAVTVLLERHFDAGGNGGVLTSPAPGARVDLGIDFTGLYTRLGNDLLAQLGTAPVVPGVDVTLPPLPLP